MPFTLNVQRHGSTARCTVVATLLTLMLLAVSASAASAADLYLAPDGSNSGDCASESAPCSSMNYIQSQASATPDADTVHFAAGDYTPDTQFLNVPGVTYVGPQEGVRATGRTGPEARIAVASGGFAFIVQADNLAFDGLTFTSPDGSGSFAIYNLNPVAIRNIAFKNIQTGMYAQAGGSLSRSDFDTNSDSMYVTGGDMTITDTRFHPPTAYAGLVNGAGGPLTITDSSFESGTYGFLTYSGSAPVSVTRTRFSPSIPNAFYNDGSTVDASNNWWGCNAGANGGPGCASLVGPGVGTTTAEPHLMLHLTADRTEFVAPGSTTLTADLLHNSAGDVLPHGLSGAVITFASDSGTLSDATRTLVDGATTNTLDVTDVGSHTASAALDNQVVNASFVAKEPAPANTVRPTVSSSAGVLTADHGNWNNNPSSYGYTWQRCSGSPSVCTTIADAHDSTYTLTDDDFGARLRARVTATNGTGSAAALSLTGAVIGSKPVSTSRPSITGTPRRGETLTADHGTWDNAPSSYSYTWQRCSGSPNVCTTIADQHDSTYTLTDDDLGTRIRVAATATNPLGSKASSYSLLTATIGAKPVSTSRPSITGTLRDGKTLTADPGTWDNDPTGYSYTWQRCSGSPSVCTTIADQHDSTYELTGDDIGTRIRVSVTATNPVGSKVSSYSLLTTAVRAAAAGV